MGCRTPAPTWAIGTALAGSILIAFLTTSFLTGIQQNPAVPDSVKAQANVELAGGVPFISDTDLQAALDQADVSEETANAALEANRQARLDGLRAALVVLAVVALLALFSARPFPAGLNGCLAGRSGMSACDPSLAASRLSWLG